VGTTARVEGTEHRFDVAPGETLLVAGLRAGLPLPYECASGTCGMCKARLREGDVVDRFPEAPALRARDRRKGRVLLCQCEASTDVVVDVPLVEGLAPEPSPRDLRLEVEALRRHGPRVVSVVARAETEVPFLPGQYVVVDVPDAGRRAYSMANLPGARLEWIVKAKPGGRATDFFFERLEVGATLNAVGPLGRAYLRPGQDRIHCVAGGSGLAPVLSIARAALAEGRRVDLYYGARTAEDLVYLDAIDAMAQAAQDRLRFMPCLSDPTSEDGWSGAVGNVGDVFFQDAQGLTEAPLYLAGPPAMVDAVLREGVIERGISADRIYFDRFF
jgi:toluene monooxygenase electron transfer component